MLKRLGPKLIARINQYNPVGPVNLRLQRRQLSLLIQAATKDIEKAYAKLAAVTSEAMADVAALEIGEASATINSVVGVELVSGRITATALKRIADNTLIEGAPSAEWWAKRSPDLRDSFRNQMREGMLNNETISDLIRRVRGRRENKFKDGIMAIPTRQAEALVRSSVLAAANAAREDLYKQNDDVIKGYQWLSTLDSRTTDICKALDGQSWYLDGRRMPGTTLRYRGPPPAHWNCRSTLVPVLRSWSDLVSNPEIRRKIKRAEATLPDGIRASMDGAVSAKLDYEQWLRGKDAEDPAFAQEILGPTKYRLWKAGKLPFTQLVDQSHNPRTVAQLRERAA